MGRMQFCGCSIWTEGRMLQDDSGIYMGYTNSKIQFVVQGGQVVITLRTDVTCMPDYRCLRIYVDGELAEQVAFVRSRQVVRLEPFPDENIHVITLHKISEASTNWIQLMDVQVENGAMLHDGTAALQETGRRVSCPDNGNGDKVLILGDSISCGYGLYQGEYEDYEDGTKCYAYLAMRELGFQAEYVTASGYGMYQDYTGYQGHTIPKLYPYTNAFISRSVFHHQSLGQEAAMALESSTLFVPDWIILYLGTNDSYNLHTETEIRNYKTCYLDFVTHLHRDYPQAALLLVAGGMTSDMNGITEELTKTIKEQMGYAAYYVEMPMQDARIDGVAKRDHPSEQTHRKFAKVLIEKIQEIKGVTA